MREYEFKIYLKRERERGRERERERERAVINGASVTVKNFKFLSQISNLNFNIFDKNILSFIEKFYVFSLILLNKKISFRILLPKDTNTFKLSNSIKNFAIRSIFNQKRVLQIVHKYIFLNYLF